MTSKQSTSYSTSQSTTHAPPQKDYAAAFGALQSQYGFGNSPTPPLPAKDAKKRAWYRWSGSRSSSTASLLPSTSERSHSDVTSQPTRRAVPKQDTLSESELRLAKLMAECGHGPMSQVNLDRR